jgi:hypothetical protein
MHDRLRRSEKELVIPRLIREHILLHEWNVPQTDVAAVRDVIRTKNHRLQTIHHEKTGWAQVDRALQSSGLALRAVLGLRPAKDDTVPELLAPREIVTHTIVKSNVEIANFIGPAPREIVAHTAVVKSDVEVAHSIGSRDRNSVQWNPLKDDFEYDRFYPPPVQGGRSNLVLKHAVHQGIETRLDLFAKPTLNSATLRPTLPWIDNGTDLASLANKLSSNETLPRHAQLDASLHSAKSNLKSRVSTAHQKPLEMTVQMGEHLEHSKYKYNADNCQYLFEQDCFPDDVSEITFGTARH